MKIANRRRGCAQILDPAVGAAADEHHIDRQPLDQRARRQAHIVKHPARLTGGVRVRKPIRIRSEEHTSELQSLMRISYAVFCLKKKKTNRKNTNHRKQLNQNKQSSYMIRTS